MIEAVAVTYEEGGDWIPFTRWNWGEARRPLTVHSIKFANGRIWDALNGWRPKERYRYNWEKASWDRVLFAS